MRWGGTAGCGCTSTAQLHAAEHAAGLQCKLSQIEARLRQAALQQQRRHKLAHKVVEVGCPPGLGLRAGEAAPLAMRGQAMEWGGTSAGQHSNSC